MPRFRRGKSGRAKLSESSGQITTKLIDVDYIREVARRRECNNVEAKGQKRKQLLVVACFSPKVMQRYHYQTWSLTKKTAGENSSRLD